MTAAAIAEKVSPQKADKIVQAPAETAPPAPLERTGPHVYAAIADITAELAIVGIGKDHKATGGGANYNFRGIDDVYNALAVKLGKHRLVIVPRVLSREQVERTSRGGGNLFYTTLTVEYDLISAVDGSKHTACVVGEAMDSGDKSSNKSMSAAYKYLAFQVFCIPIEGDDSEAQTHEIAPPLPALDRAINHLRNCSIDKGSFVTAWEFNKNPWKGLLDAQDYAALVAEMKTIAATFKDAETVERDPTPAPERPAPGAVSRAASPNRAPGADAPIGDDDIPEAFR